MSETAQQEQPPGWLGLTGRLLGGLPVSFLGLLAVNVIFLACLFWFLHAMVETRAEAESQLAQARTVVLTKILDVCGAHVVK